MIQTVALCHRWLRRPPVPRLRVAFVLEAREALSRQLAASPDLDEALDAREPTDEQVRTVSRAIEALIKNRRANSFLISWGFLTAKEDKP
jgi:uncharacterized protein YqcC (DUF446 family)